MFNKHDVRADDLFGPVSFGGGGREWHGNSQGSSGYQATEQQVSNVTKAASVVSGIACSTRPNQYTCGAAAITAAADGVINHNWSGE